MQQVDEEASPRDHTVTCSSSRRLLILLIKARMRAWMVVAGEIRCEHALKVRLAEDLCIRVRSRPWELLGGRCELESGPCQAYCRRHACRSSFKQS